MNSVCVGWTARLEYITMTSQWARWHLKSPASLLFAQLLVQAQLKKHQKVRVIGFCVRNSLVIGEFPTQKASNAENVSIWWRHHGRISHTGFTVESCYHTLHLPQIPQSTVQSRNEHNFVLNGALWYMGQVNWGAYFCSNFVYCWI